MSQTGRARLTAFWLAALLGADPIAAQPVTAPSDPSVTLWLWHGAQDLRGLHAVAGAGVRVALLERTIEILPGGIRVTPRRSPLWLDDATPRIAVVHMEVDPRVTLGQFAALETEIADAALEAYDAQNIDGLQMDFDAPRSMRGRYASILRTLDAERPAGMSLEMTALGSWCTSDRWLRDVPVDRIVPMLFGPGHESERIRASLAHGPLPEPRCRADHGFREGDPVASSARIHVFPREPWTLERALEVWRSDDRHARAVR